VGEAGENRPSRWRRWLEWLRIACVSDWARIVLAATVVGAIMSISGGFGAPGKPVLVRVAYGECLVLAGVALGFIGSRLVVPRPWFETRPFISAAIMTAVVGLPMSSIAALLASGRGGQPLSLAVLSDVVGTTLVTTAGIIMLAFLVQARTVAETHVAAPDAPPARFLARLPSRLAGAQLWAVQAEDHYLRLHTSQGEDLVLMRLADALVELEGIEGARTHRSWWVARDAVEAAERAEGRAVLTLKGGLRAPVSRAYAKALGAAGWFSPRRSS
jgi:hypothetical protein